MDNKALTEADAIAKLAGTAMDPVINEDLGVAFVYKDVKNIDIESTLPAPLRVREKLGTNSVSGFCAYMNRFGDENSVVMLNFDETSDTPVQAEGVIDYHKAKQYPDWGEHVIRLVGEYSKDWSRWIRGDGHKFSQSVFAEFIEDNIESIISHENSPTAADMLEIANTLEVNTQSHFKRGQNLSNGDVTFEYKTDSEGAAGNSGQLKIPESFYIATPVFKGGDKYKIECKFRYRVSEGNLQIGYKMMVPDLVKETAMEGIKELLTQNLNESIQVIEAVINRPQKPTY